jgi:tetratricopeptide (TPR) repeat protein
MRFIAILAAAISASLFAAPANAVTKKDVADCTQHTDLDRQLAGCTRILNTKNLPKRPRAISHNNRCLAWMDKGEFDRALAECNAAIRADSKYPIAYINRCLVRVRKGDFDQAIADCSDGIRLDPKTANAYSNRCAAWILKGELDRAITDCNEAIRLNPRYADAFYARCNAWNSKGDFDRAISDCSEVIRLAPKAAPAYTDRGNAWQLKGEFDIAMADCNEAIRLVPKTAEAYMVRGMAWRDKGEHDRAIADYSEAIRLNTRQQSLAYAFRGEVWRLKGDLDRALADQDKAIGLYTSRTNPRKANVYVMRGDTLRYRGDLDRALADYDEALREWPDYIAAFTGRGLTYEKMGDPARARAEFEKAVSSHSPLRALIAKSALETARARLAALKSGAAQPVIPAAPARVVSATSIPTPEAAVPKLAPAAIVHHDRRVALVIGNSAYKNVPALPNPERDAEKIAESLRAVGFDTVTLANNLTREKLVDALRTFADQVAKADWATVYYAGHGMEVGGVNYLVPVDARLASDSDAETEAVSLDQVMTSVDSAHKLKLILLDACRDNPFVQQMRHTAAPKTAATGRSSAGGVVVTRSIGRGLGEVKVTGATLVVYAAKHGQVALDGDGANSPFAVAVVQRLATPNVEINKLFRLVRDDVMEATAGRQEPYTYGSLPGHEDFYFVQANQVSRQ